MSATTLLHLRRILIMTKAEIMRAANIVIENLMYCDDREFVDRLVSAVVNGEEFTEEEIAEETD